MFPVAPGAKGGLSSRASTANGMTEETQAPDGTPPEESANPPAQVNAIADEVRQGWSDIARIAGAELAAAQTREARALLQHEVAEVEERVHGDEPAAARGYLAAFNARPSFRPPLDALIRLYTRRKSVGNLTKLFDALVKASPSAQDRASALVQRGELQIDRLSDPAGARQSFETAISTDPGDRLAWLDLQRLALRTNDHELLLRVLAHLGELSQDPARRARLLVEFAEEQSTLGTAESAELAASSFRDAAASPGGRWLAWSALERFGERASRPHDVVDALEQRAVLAQELSEGAAGPDPVDVGPLATATPDEARNLAADLWSRAARVRLNALADAPGARAAIEQALVLKPDSPTMHYLAMTLADQAGDIEHASAHAAWLLEREFGDPSLRASLHFRRAESEALAEDMTAAATSLRAALAMDPASAAVRGALLEQLIAAGDGPEVVAEFDRLAERSDVTVERAALLRAAAMHALALQGNLDEAARRFRQASELDAHDVISRRALVTLLGRRRADAALDEGAVRQRVSAIDALLPLATDADERVALLMDRFFLERHALRDAKAAVVTAEALVEATQGSPWAQQTAALLHASVGAPREAARWAKTLATRQDLPGGDLDRRQWSAAAARWLWAAGDDAQARELALAAHRQHPDDVYLAGLSLRLSLAARDAKTVLDVVTRTALPLDADDAVRWLVMASALLGSIGADDEMRLAIEQALARNPASPAVRSAVLATTRWRGDTKARARIVDAVLEQSAMGGEEMALAIERALVHAFVDHDLPGAGEITERAVVQGGSDEPVVALFHALVRGASLGPDAEDTVSALQILLSAIPSNDPMRVGFELEVARALGSSSSTRDQALAARELVDEDSPQLAAPRLLALLDAIQREDRAGVPIALRRVADLDAGETSRALRAVAMAGLRAQGRAAEANALATDYMELPASTITRSEAAPTLDRAKEHGEALRARAALADPKAQSSSRRLAANWFSMARHDDEAREEALAVLAERPDDVVALDVLRVAARRLRRWDEVTRACEALAKRTRNPERAGLFWEEAGLVAIEGLQDESRGERSLRSALDAAPKRAVAYRKLRETLQGRGDTAGLEALVTRRVAAIDDPVEKSELYWEQARLRRALGLRDGALEATHKVLSIAPDHVAALALVTEIHASAGRVPELAEALVALANCRETPAAQRRTSRMAAMELFDLRLGRPSDAVAQVDAMIAEGWGDPTVLERGVDISSRAELWDDALRFARKAIERASTPGDRARAMLRVALLLRDRVNDIPAAREQGLKAHESFPANLEILRTLHGLSAPEDRPRNARRAIEALRELLRNEAPTLARVEGLAEAAHLGGDGPLEHAAWRMAEHLGAETMAARLGEPPARPGISLRDPAWSLRFRAPEDSGRAVTMIETVLPDLVELAGLTTDALKVGRGDRIRGAHPLRSVLAPYVMLCGFNDFELYLGGDPGRLAVMPGDPVALVVGRQVATPLDESTRFELVRALLLVGRGVAPLAVESVESIVAKVVTAMVYAELPLSSAVPRNEMLLKPVSKAVSRKVRRAVSESGRALAQTAALVDELTKAALAMCSTARRGALAVTGLVPCAFRDLARVERLPESSPITQVAEQRAARELMLFGLGDAVAQIARDAGVDRG